MDRPVSIVIPMYNAGPYIGRVLEAIFAQVYKVPIEVIVVNDGSTDNSLKVVESFKGNPNLKVISQRNQGAVVATNNGFKAATHDIICGVDSDVVLVNDWLRRIMPEFDDPLVGAVQGYYRTPRDGALLTRVMGYDVEARYDAIKTKHVTQVCTGNTAYRREAIKKVALFDPRFTYGYDNDMSYRLQRAGYKLVFRKDAVCDHYWKADLGSYVRQQYRSAYGRMQLIRKHTDRLSGDSVSGLRMIMQVPLTLFFFLTLVSGAVLTVATDPAATEGLIGVYLLFAALATFIVMYIDRLAFAAGVSKKHKDSAAAVMPFVHILRNFVWCAAFVVWVFGFGWLRKN